MSASKTTEGSQKSMRLAAEAGLDDTALAGVVGGAAATTALGAKQNQVAGADAGNLHHEASVSNTAEAMLAHETPAQAVVTHLNAAPQPPDAHGSDALHLQPGAAVTAAAEAALAHAGSIPQAMLAHASTPAPLTEQQAIDGIHSLERALSGSGANLDSGFADMCSLAAHGDAAVQAAAASAIATLIGEHKVTAEGALDYIDRAAGHGSDAGWAVNVVIGFAGHADQAGQQAAGHYISEWISYGLVSPSQAISDVQSAVGSQALSGSQAADVLYGMVNFFPAWQSTLYQGNLVTFDDLQSAVQDAATSLLDSGAITAAQAARLGVGGGPDQG